MKIIKPLVVLGLCWGLLCFVTLDVKAENRLTKEESIAAGKILFETKNCSICHSLQGDKKRIGSDLLRWKNLESPMFWAAIMWNHVPEMAIALDNGVIDYPTFENDEFANIVAYINSFADNIGRFQFKANKNRGKFLFNYLGCVKCHTVRNKGGTVGPNLTYVAKTIDKDYVFAGKLLSHAIFMSKAVEYEKIPWPRMQGYEAGHIFLYFKYIANEEQ